MPLHHGPSLNGTSGSSICDDVWHIRGARVYFLNELMNSWMNCIESPNCLAMTVATVIIVWIFRNYRLVHLDHLQCARYVIDTPINMSSNFPCLSLRTIWEETALPLSPFCSTISTWMARGPTSNYALRFVEAMPRLWYFIICPCVQPQKLTSSLN